MEKRLTLKEASAYLTERGFSIEPTSLRRACWQGRLKAEQEGQGNRATWYTWPEALDEFIATGRRPGRPKKEP